MRRTMVMVVVLAVLGLGFGGYAMATAQDGSGTPETDARGTPCASPAASPSATPAAVGGTPTSVDGCAPAAGEAIAVDIADFAYDPDPVTVPVGGTVVWTNQDPVPHTATALEDRDVLQTGRLNQGEGFDQTFDAAGTYEYFCEYHADMRGTIVVE